MISRFGTEEQKQTWLPGICDGTETMAFAITEPDAGTNSHNITTTARRDGDEWLLKGQKIYISGVDEAEERARRRAHRGREDRQAQAVPVRRTDRRRRASSFTPIPMEIVSPELQFQVFIDDVRLPADALVGDEDGGLVQLFAGLNPERIMAASFSTGLARYALDRATAYVKEREVWGAPIGTHQGIAHPLAQSKIEIELARLMTQKAAALYEEGDDMGAGEAANMAKYAAAEAACDAADRAVQTHGGNGITQEYGVAGLLVAARAGRIAPVSREMILNFVGMHSPGPAEVLLSRPRPAVAELWSLDMARTAYSGSKHASHGELAPDPTQRSTMTELVHYGLTDGVATITLDSPHNRNALSRQLVTELFEALDRAEAERGRAGGADPLGRPGVLLRCRPVRGGGRRHGRRAPRRWSRCSAGSSRTPGRSSRGWPGRSAPAASASSPPATSWCAATTSRSPSPRAGSRSRRR